MDDPALPNRLGALALALHDRQAQAVARGMGLSASKAAAVVSVGADPGIGVGRLADVVGVTQPVATRLCDELAAAGLLRKARKGREVALRLTPEGDAARARVLAIRRGAAEAALGALPAGAALLGPLVDAVLAALTTDRRTCDRMCRLCDEDACGREDCPVERRARELGE